MRQPYKSADPAHNMALLTTHPAPISCLSHPHINSVYYYAHLYEKEPDVADNATVCCSNQTHPSSDDSTHVTDEEECTDSANGSLGANTHSINTTLVLLDVAGFQYYKSGTRGTTASTAQILEQPQHTTTRSTAWRYIIQVNSLHELPMVNTIFNTIRL